MPHTNLTREEIEALKARVDLAAVVRAAGVELKPKGKNLFGRCPFHEDDTPSLSVNPEARLWQCFGCRAGGDIFKFLELSENLSFHDQLERVRQLAGELPAEPRRRKVRPAPPPPAASGFSRVELLTKVAELYGARFKENPAGREYLKSRGLDSRELWEGFQLGLSDGSLGSTLPDDGPLFEALRGLGVLNERGQEHFHGCLVVPLTHPDFEGVVGLYGRRLNETGPGRHRVLPGPLHGVLNWQALQASKRIVLVEGVFDVLALWQAGVREATCLLGCTQLPPELEPLFSRYATREVVLCLDGDEAGHEGSRRLVERLAQSGLAVRQAVLPSSADPGALVERGQAEDLRLLLKNAPALATGEPAEAVQLLEDGFVLELGDTTYQVKLVPPFGGRLRVRLRASRGERLHVDKLDLEAHRARHGLTVQLIRSLDLPRLDAERHLTALLRQAEEWARTHAETGPASKLAEEAPELTPGERDEALDFLKQADLMERVLADMEALGYVGEETGKLLVYLIGISRKLRKPLSGIIRSQSGSGKSSLAELLEQLTPAEDVRFYSRISPMALSWGPTDLRHKLIILEERMGGEGADYQIRTLQSRQRISQLVAVKDPATGQMAADFREVHGPIAFLETTTQNDLNPENTTRCYEIFLDESEAQTRRIQEAQRRARVPGAHDPEELRKAITRRHHNAQRLLEQKPVFLPFVEHVTFPTRWLRTRRDHERFLALIEASALLHQHQRKSGTTEEGTSYVLADLEDYRLAYGLTRRVLEATFHELSQTARDLWAQARELTLERNNQAPQDVVFTRRDLRLRSGVMDHAVRSALAELVELEYAQIVSGCNGKTLHYRLLVFEEEGLSPVGCLTTPEQLAALVRPR